MSTQEDIEFEVEIDEPTEHNIRRDRLAQAVMYTADWTVETAISQLKQGNIFLQPSFQRRDAWLVERKSRLIESILLGLPIPQIVLAERKDQRGTFIVLDGKQRLLTLLQFVGEAHGSPNNSFRLRGVEVLTEYKGMAFSELDIDAKREFLNYAIRSSVIRNWPDSAFLEIVFVRLNEGSVKLSPQELRQGISPGPFTSYLEKASAESLPLRALLKLDAPDFRMRDAELLLRLIAFSRHGAEYRGNMKDFLDMTTDRTNTEWSTVEHSIVQLSKEIDAAIAFGMDTFQSTKFGRKWLSDRYEAPLNRAVLEVQVAGFLDPRVRSMLSSMQPKVVAEFQRMSETSEFNRSVETTTKSLSSTRARFGHWGEAMRQLTSGLVSMPKIGND